jgi:hypothetical protein
MIPVFGYNGNTWTKRHFWTAADLEQKLRLFQDYFNRQRVHSGLGARLPEPGEAKVPLKLRFISVAATLSRTLSDTHRRMISGIRR